MCNHWNCALKVEAEPFDVLFMTAQITIADGSVVTVIVCNHCSAVWKVCTKLYNDKKLLKCLVLSIQHTTIFPQQ